MSMTNSRSAGSLVSRAWEMPSDASRSSMDQLRAKKTAEHAALKQLVSLRREVQDRKLDSAAQRLRERRWNESAAYKADIGKDRPTVHNVSKADDATVLALSTRLNQAMAVLEPDANKRGWFRLFQHMDDDGSGKMTFLELEDMVRNELKVTSKDLDDRVLKQVWKVLDADGSGYIDAGEFGRFMRPGEAAVGETWKTKLHAQRHMEAQAQLAVRHKEKRAMEGVAPASEKDVNALSVVLNRRLSTVFPGGSGSWFKLYVHVDQDRSGKITFDEFREMARKGLRLTQAELPAAKVAAAWRAMDADKNGYITSGEFGAFMKRGALELRTLQPQPSWKQKLHRRRSLDAQAMQAELKKERRANSDDVHPAPADQVHEMSILFNEIMAWIEPDQNKRTWYRLFRRLDGDGSGKITFIEFEEMVRGELRLLASELGIEQLRSVWRALDINGDGFITVREFGAFMRPGEAKVTEDGTGGTGWKARLHAQRRVEVQELLAERHKERRTMAGVGAAADEAMVRKLSLQLTKAMANLEKDPNRRGWFRLFRHMDGDHSGKITFDELEELCRGELRLDQKELKEDALRSLWRALDADRNGYITVGEFGKFMRPGEEALREEQPQSTWKERLLEQRQLEVEAQLAETHKEKRSMDGVVAAGADDVRQFSTRFNQRMHQLFPVKETNPTWFRLFKHVDGDDAGKITYPQVAKLVRHVLRLPADAVPEANLRSLWRALDDDGSGYVTVGEFGKFMRLGARPQSSNLYRRPSDPPGHALVALQRRRSSSGYLYNQHEEAMDNAQQVRRSTATAGRYKAEMEQLQQELAELQQDEQEGSPQRSPPPQQHASRGERPATAPAHRSPGSEAGLFGLRGRAGSAARHRASSGSLPGL